MRYILFFPFLILSIATAWAQEADLPGRDISLVVLDKRGRPIENIIVHSLNFNNAGMTNRNGLFVFTGMTDNDQITVSLPRYGETVIPVAGKESIVVKVLSARRYLYADSEGHSVRIDKRERVRTPDLIFVQDLLAHGYYTSLTDLLSRANVAGLSGGSFRGPASIYSSNEPLVVVNGSPVGTLGDANRMVNIYDIFTIEVKKNSSEWGVRGANGVILIKTR